MNSSFNEPKYIYAAWRRDAIKRNSSSSGGIANALSENWIEHGGVVYGTAFIPPFHFSHIRCTELNELWRLQGSKYVASSMHGIMNSISKDLALGLKVLFIGTPCQVAAVNAKFKLFPHLLFTVDLLCHGTPNETILKSSLPKDVLEQPFNNVQFRHDGIYEFCLLHDGEVIWKRPLNKDLYMKGFFKSVFNRDCCYKCKYSQIKRVSDITLGDFWGVDLNCVKTELEKGVSLVLANTTKGEELLSRIKDEVVMIERPLLEAVGGNLPLKSPSSITWRYKVFKYMYPKIGFKGAAIFSMPDVCLKNLLR